MVKLGQQRDILQKEIQENIRRQNELENQIQGLVINTKQQQIESNKELKTLVEQNKQLLAQNKNLQFHPSEIVIETPFITIKKEITDVSKSLQYRTLNTSAVDTHIHNIIQSINRNHYDGSIDKIETDVLLAYVNKLKHQVSQTRRSR